MKREKITYSKKGLMLSLIAGIIILCGSLLQLYVYSIAEQLALFTKMDMPIILLFIPVLGITSGCFVLAGSVLIYADQKNIGGILIIIFSFLSFLAGGGILFIGMILGIISGILVLKK
jgi:hypothetical protein